MTEFKIIKKDKKSKARLGKLSTPHGTINTPCFVPVATKGAIRGLDFKKAKSFGADIFMVNTFHFFYDQRYKIVKQHKGLHNFLNIDYPLMTDSGGFQVFSFGLAREHGVGKIKSHQKKPQKNLVKVNDNGVWFVSPKNGQKLEMTPEISIKVQEQLGADIIFSFDECTSPLSSHKYHKESLQRTNAWALRSLKALKTKQAMFGIVQGGRFKDLRIESAQFINDQPFFGIGIGGSFGDKKDNLSQVLEWIMPYLSESKPKHLLGIGEPYDLLLSIEKGIDLFDCVMPTRLARHDTALTYKGKINLKSSAFLKDKTPIDRSCQCQTCRQYTKSYICHLLKEKEIYAVMLLVEHNLFWMLNFLKEIRESIKKDEFVKFKTSFLKKWR